MIKNGSFNPLRYYLVSGMFKATQRVALDGFFELQQDDEIIIVPRHQKYCNMLLQDEKDLNAPTVIVNPNQRMASHEEFCRRYSFSSMGENSRLTRNLPISSNPET